MFSFNNYRFHELQNQKQITIIWTNTNSFMDLFLRTNNYMKFFYILWTYIDSNNKRYQFCEISDRYSQLNTHNARNSKAKVPRELYSETLVKTITSRNSYIIHNIELNLKKCLAKSRNCGFTSSQLQLCSTDR